MEQENLKSKFSSGLNIIIRLDNLWKNCQDFKRKGRYADWNDELDTIWLELARDIPKHLYYDQTTKDGKTIKGYKSQFEEFEKELQKLLPFDDKLNSFKKPKKDIFIRRNKQYKILMEKQLFLARLENEYGKGTTYEEEEDDF